MIYKNLFGAIHGQTERRLVLLYPVITVPALVVTYVTLPVRIGNLQQRVTKMCILQFVTINVKLISLGCQFKVDIVVP